MARNDLQVRELIALADAATGPTSAKHDERATKVFFELAALAVRRTLPNGRERNGSRGIRPTR